MFGHKYHSLKKGKHVAGVDTADAISMINDK